MEVFVYDGGDDGVGWQLEFQTVEAVVPGEIGYDFALAEFVVAQQTGVVFVEVFVVEAEAPVVDVVVGSKVPAAEDVAVDVLTVGSGGVVTTSHGDEGLEEFLVCVGYIVAEGVGHAVAPDHELAAKLGVHLQTDLDREG